MVATVYNYWYHKANWILTMDPEYAIIYVLAYSNIDFNNVISRDYL